MQVTKMSLLFLVFVPVILLNSVVMESQASSPSCTSKCGGVEIPYPFGIGDVRCAKEASFLLTCNDTYYNPPRPFWGGVEIVNINLTQGEATGLHEISRDCYNDTSKLRDEGIFPLNLSGSPFTFSTRNKFTVTGCATTGYLTTDTNSTGFYDACSLLCPNSTDGFHVPNNTCSGLGCCEIPVKERLTYFNVKFETYYSAVQLSSRPCSYAFLVEENKYDFNPSILTSNASFTMKLPVVLDWAVDSCGPNSTQVNSPIGTGHLCRCLSGYEGDPYDLTTGCTDIDECATPAKFSCYGLCINNPGGYFCACPGGTSGNPSEEFACKPIFTQKTNLTLGFALLFAGGFFLLLLSAIITLLWKRSQKRRKRNLRKKYFRQNHGLLLQQLISSNEDDTQRTKIFSLKELEKATNNFDDARIIGRGGHGTVYKRLLLDQRVVAIKKSKVILQIEIDQFINEVALLSRIDHRNVVRLFGCCLESEVPLLVYEFISNGTLFDHLHVRNRDSYLSWDERLRIAIEVASAIAYLHFASSKSIFHRDLKSVNILLDEKLTAKISDFGASKSIMLDQTHITTVVQGTFGYLDPEYCQTGKLTDKSDVYSFGVILVELISGEKPISHARSEVKRNLITHFFSVLEENQLFEILEASIKKETRIEELEVVARLAGACLAIRGEDRPTMKEVETTLETLRGFKKKKHVKRNQEETDSLLLYETTSLEDDNSGSTRVQFSSKRSQVSSSFFQ